MAVTLTGFLLDLQDSVLGPLLFLFYILMSCIKVIHHSTIKLLADDIALYKEIVSSHYQLLLHEDLSSIYEWYTAAAEFKSTQV